MFTITMRLFFSAFLLFSVLFAEAGLSLDSLKNELSHTENDSTISMLYRDISWEYLEISLDSALLNGEKALSFASKSASSYCIAQAHYQIGVVHYYKSELEMAIENLISSIENFEKTPYKKGLANATNVLAAVYLAANQNQKAKSIFKKSYEYAASNKDTASMITALSNVAATCFYVNQYDSILYYSKLQLALDSNHHGIETTYGHLSAAYEGLDNIDSAMIYIDLSLQINPDNTTELSRKADLLMKTGATDDALKIYKRLEKAANRVGNISRLESSYGRLTAFFEKTAQFDSALIYYRKEVALADSIQKMSNLAAIEEINTKYETGKKEAEIIRQRAELKQRQYFEYALALGILMLTALGIVIYLRYREKSKANVIISEFNDELNQRNEELASQRDEIERQKDKIELAHEEITDSINYAKRIQNAILPSEKQISTHLPKSFFLYKPKDVVSGDFYWIHPVDDKILFAAVDCTGHGVPGAFVSIVAYNLLNKMIEELNLVQPAEILTNLNKYLADALTQQGELDVKDGMDISLCLLDKNRLTLEYSGANNPLYIIRDGQLLETKANKMAVGSYYFRDDKTFTNHIIKLENSDCIYSFTDGFADQFGGPKGKKFMYGKFKKLLLEISTNEPLKQKELLLQEFESWKGNHEQLDDVCIIGVKI